MKQAWIYLLIAGILEIVWAYFMNLSNGFSLLVPTFLTLFFGAICFYFLEKSIQYLGTGISYTVFTGMGTVGTTLLGIFVFNQNTNTLQVVAILIILTAIVGLKNSDKHEGV